MLRLLLGLLAAAALLTALYGLGRRLETGRAAQARGQMSEGFGQLPTLTRGGRTYVRRPEVKTVLLLGIDRPLAEARRGFRQGGQADFILLLAIDHSSKTMYPLQIDRDTVTDVRVLGVLGNAAGVRRMQICLSSAYGASAAQSCAQAAWAVEQLLPDLTVDACCALDVDGIGPLNAALGGVTVSFQEDASAIDAAMTAGTSLRLSDAQAEALLRARLGLADDSNEARMCRQEMFMQAAWQTLRQRLAQEPMLIDTLLDALETHVYTDLSRARMIGEAARVSGYAVAPVSRLAGEYALDAAGFTAFYAAPEAADKWVLSTLYEPRP